LLQAQLFIRSDWQAAIAGEAPLILLGDLNSLPGSGPYRALTRYLRSVRELGSSDPARPYFSNMVSRAGCRSYFCERRAPAAEPDRASLPCCTDGLRSFPTYSWARSFLVMH